MVVLPGGGPPPLLVQNREQMNDIRAYKNFKDDGLVHLYVNGYVYYVLGSRLMGEKDYSLSNTHDRLDINEDTIQEAQRAINKFRICII